MIIHPDTELFSGGRTSEFPGRRLLSCLGNKRNGFRRQPSPPPPPRSPPARRGTVAIPNGSRSHVPLALRQTGGPAFTFDFEICSCTGRRAIHACLVILTLSRVGNYHEQFIYRRVGCKCVLPQPTGRPSHANHPPRRR